MQRLGVNFEGLLASVDAKVLISLVSVIIGWILAQATSIAKDLWASRTLRRGLLLELEDIQNQLHRLELLHARQLQVYALKGIEPNAGLPIPHMFFEQYFKDAFTFLNREQRLSYQLIHGALDNLNKKSEGLVVRGSELVSALSVADDKSANKCLAEWRKEVTEIYKAVRVLRWHITYHLSNRKTPKLDLLGPMHKSYLELLEQLDADVKAIIEQARSLKREDLEAIYRERDFTRS